MTEPLECTRKGCKGAFILYYTKHKSNAGYTLVCHGKCDVCDEKIEGVFKGFTYQERANIIALNELISNHKRLLKKKREE